MTAPPVRRCAIYTRKSSEEGLEQDFNSLDAQREACAAYIQSQQYEGWRLVPAVYDDGGRSGGTLERPALQRLLGDIAQRCVDVIVVYKVDRLTRSLMDFAKLVEHFDAHAVSFVSITQQFNTTTSMGRLTLNVLLSFAQFEREVTAERIRDKIAASKRKGLWMGGCPPLGYDVHERALVINPTEAATVRHIFERYLALKSVAQLKAELDAAGIVSKRRPGRTSPGGTPMQRGALYKLLSNPLYVGRIRHKTATYPGLHAPIVDEADWKAVQALLAQQRNEHHLRPHTKQPSLLTGCLYDALGRRLTPTHAVKQGRRYRYYISQPLTAGATRAQCEGGLRLPAAELEKAVVERLRQCLTDRALLYTLASTDSVSTAALDALFTTAAAVAASWDTLPSLRRRVLVQTLLHRVVVSPDQMTLELDVAGVCALLGAETVERPHAVYAPVTSHSVTFPVRLCLTRGGLKLVMQGPSRSDTAPDPTLVKLLRTAHAYHRQLDAAAEEATMQSLAADAGVTSSYFTRVLRLAWLAPDVTLALLSGQHPAEMNALRLLKLSSRLPIDWPGQRRLLGIEELR